MRPLGHCSASPLSLYPSPRPPTVPVGDGRAGAGVRRWDMASGRIGTSRHASLLPMDSLGSEWYLRALRGGCDYGGSGQGLRAALWYHAVRLRHHRVVGARLHGVQLCVWVSAAIAIPGIPVPALSVFAQPSSFHPSLTPPRPPFQGGAGGGGVGRWRLGCARMPVLRFGWRWPMGLYGCSSGVLQGHTFLLLVQFSTYGGHG